MSDHNNGHHPKGFLDDKMIKEILEKRFKKQLDRRGLKEGTVLTDKRLKKIEEWYLPDKESRMVYKHSDPIGPGIKNCDIAVGHYMDWIAREQTSISSFTNTGSYRDENSFLFTKGGSRLYFATVSPFQDPYDFRDINLTERNHGLLIATFMSMESPQFYSLGKDYTENDSGRVFTEDELLEFILEDTAGIYEIEAYFDSEPINGCTVIRNKFQRTTDIPKGNIMNVKQENLLSDNSLDQLYLWIGLALKPEFINQGDHLLEFKVNSRNYRINANLQISGMVGVPKK